MDKVIQDWTRHFQDNWSDFRHLKVLSFHDTKGDMITNTTSSTDPTIIVPAQDGNSADQRKQGIKFVCVKLRLDFSSLAKAGVTTHF